MIFRENDTEREASTSFYDLLFRVCFLSSGHE